MVQMAFRDGVLAEEATWQAVVLIPKGKKDHRVIGLVEVRWKVVAAILNRTEWQDRSEERRAIQ